MSRDDFTPDGFVPLANWDNRHRGNNDGHSVEWKLLSDAAKAGKVPGMKVGGSGRWIVHEASAVAYLLKTQAQSQPAQVPAKPASQKHGTDEAIAALTTVLSSMVTNQFTLLHAIEQIADAVQRIADQKPLARMDDVAICEPDIDCHSNGFHS